MPKIEIYQKENNQMTNSKNVADVFNKIHRDVLRDIKNLDCSEEFRVRNFAQSSYTSEQNKVLPCVEMTKDGFTFLCMGYRGKKAAQFKEAYISAFNAMESALKTMRPTLTTMNEIVKKSETDKEIASACGSELAKYKKVKKQNEEDFDKAAKEVQMVLGFIK